MISTPWILSYLITTYKIFSIKIHSLTQWHSTLLFFWGVSNWQAEFSKNILKKYDPWIQKIFCRTTNPQKVFHITKEKKTGFKPPLQHFKKLVFLIRALKFIQTKVQVNSHTVFRVQLNFKLQYLKYHGYVKVSWTSHLYFLYVLQLQYHEP